MHSAFDSKSFNFKSVSLMIAHPGPSIDPFIQWNEERKKHIEFNYKYSI
jgi:hypothetical protein